MVYLGGVAPAADASEHLKSRVDVDLLVNNAGIGAAGEIGVTTLDAWRRALDVNLWDVIHGRHRFVPGMRARRRGHVLNVASAAGLMSPPSMGATRPIELGPSR